MAWASSASPAPGWECGLPGVPFVAAPGIVGPDHCLPTVEGVQAQISPDYLIATGGDVTVYYGGESAADADALYLNGTMLFFDPLASPGQSVNLGNFAAGTVIPFQLADLSAGTKWNIGPGSTNADGLIHAAFAPWTMNGAIPVNGEFFSFEDLFGGGDYDLDDALFVASGVTLGPMPPPTPTPEISPSYMILVGALLCCAGKMWRRQAV